MKDTDIIDSHPGNISLAGRPDSLKNSLVGNFRYANSPEPMYAGAAAPTPPAPPTPAPDVTFRITIIDTEANILSRVGDPLGTAAFGSDTKDLYIYNTLGFDKWTHYEDN